MELADDWAWKADSGAQAQCSYATGYKIKYLTVD